MKIEFIKNEHVNMKFLMKVNTASQLTSHYKHKQINYKKVCVEQLT